MKTLNNYVQLIGNLGKDPELKTFGEGNAVCKFPLATNEFYTDKNGEKKQNTDWHNIVAWGKKAQIMSDILQKGQQVIVNGKLKNRKYENKSGETVYITEIVVDDFLLTERKNTASMDMVSEAALPF